MDIPLATSFQSTTPRLEGVNARVVDGMPFSRYLKGKSKPQGHGHGLPRDSSKWQVDYGNVVLERRVMILQRQRPIDICGMILSREEYFHSRLHWRNGRRHISRRRVEVLDIQKDLYVDRDLEIPAGRGI